MRFKFTFDNFHRWGCVSAATDDGDAAVRANPTIEVDSDKTFMRFIYRKLEHPSIVQIS